MNRIAPLLVNEADAARLMGLTVAEFRRLVADGHLPGPHEIARGVRRWVVEDLRQIITGGAVEGGIQW